MSILIIDNGPYPRVIRQASWIRSYLGGVDAEIAFGVHNRIPSEPERYDGVILSGGIEPLFSEAPWLMAELKLIERCAEKDIPLLGICYGHQLIGRALMGNHAVRENHSPEFGWKKVRLLQQDSPLFRGISTEFSVFCSHFHEVCELTPAFRLLAESDRCSIQAFEYVGKRIWGVQFHPEINIAWGRMILVLNGLATLKPSLASPKTLLAAYDSGIAPKLFSNFIEITRTAKAENVAR